ncbi:C40 family peptidase [Tumebacillus flagellatus]|uniref:NlpC/P60 domain-containing protein n=1 Tax=Tumebacillus flagellatus TaxID=1157490 RepID=A0A074LTM0_9BACL|nr:C40 family peptidase [Tumebacillus flagellatus]KEO83945.1 hypothetical protein EL26_07080 [Tumebacillus flagellatus]
MQSWKKGLFIGLFSSLLWEQQSVQAAMGLTPPSVQRPFPPALPALGEHADTTFTPAVPIWEPPKEPEQMESVTNVRILLQQLHEIQQQKAESEPAENQAQALPALSSRGGLLKPPKIETPEPPRSQPNPETQPALKPAPEKNAPSSNTSTPASNPAPTINNQSGATATAGGKIATVALKYQGTPYVYGGTTPSGFDCSGFIQYVFQECGITLSRTTYEQVGSGTSVSRANLQPGDLVFFSCGGKATSHAGIYLGGGRFVHADQSRGIAVTELDDNYWSSVYQTGVRVR